VHIRDPPPTVSAQVDTQQKTGLNRKSYVDAVRDLLSGNKSHNSQPMYVVQADPIRNYYDDNDVQRQHFNQQQPPYPISPYTSGHTTSQV